MNAASTPETETWWHGSPYEIALGATLLPGRELAGGDRFGMGRDKAVFITDYRQSAIQMGADRHPGRYGCWATDFAPFLYEVEPHEMYDRFHDDGPPAPHPHMLSNERQCQRAIVLIRYRCVNVERFAENVLSRNDNIDHEAEYERI